MSWVPFQIDKSWHATNLDHETAQKMNDMGATDIRVIYATEEMLIAVVWVP
jgi:hypothetical protein